MAIILPLAETQFTDANGVPLADGSVYFYVPGTLTPKDTWQDAGGTTLNTNPVVLDAAGRAIIYGSGNYRQIVKDKDGNQIWDQLTSGYTTYSEYASIADLEAVDVALSGIVMVESYYGDGTGRGGGALAVLATTPTPDGAMTYGTVYGQVLRRIGITTIHAYMAGAKGDDVNDDTAAINLAAASARSLKLPLDLRGAPVAWRIMGRINLLNQPYIIAHEQAPVHADITGTYVNGWAIEIGDPTQLDNVDAGRCHGTVIDGQLFCYTTRNATELNGIYIKGSWLSVGCVIAEFFNGTGVHISGNWDSVFESVVTSECGNATTYALIIDSNGDTSNCTHFLRVQCEASYQRGLYVDAIRTVIDNIHAERLAVIATTGDATYGYLNHKITISNGELRHALIDCLTTGTAPDGTALAATTMHVVLNGAGVSYNDVVAAATIYHDYGTQNTLVNLQAAAYQQLETSGHITLINPQIAGTVLLETNVEIVGGTIGTIDLAYNAGNIVMMGGALTALTASGGKINGNITFNGTSVSAVASTLSPQAGYRPVTFLDATIGTFNGAGGQVARVLGGHIATCALAANSEAVLENVECETFDGSASLRYLTRGVRVSGSVTGWSVPTGKSYPAGTVTERVGYVAGAGQKFWQNTDGAATWVAIA
jgi:hypothetical protein